MFGDISYTVEHGVATVVIERPEVRNALRGRTLDEMCEALARAENDPTIGVIVVTGAGEEAFCAGGDLSTVPDQQAAPGQELDLSAVTRGEDALRWFLAFRNLTKPTIAKVRGYCVGMGNELNLLCDLTVASESARFGQAGPRVGSVPIVGGTQLLPLVAGLKRAKEILFCCRLYSGSAAVEMGLANVVVPDAELDAEVARWCDELLGMSPQSLRLAKLSLSSGLDAQWSSVLHGLELVRWFSDSGDLLEGVSAFLEKRPPRFRA